MASHLEEQFAFNWKAIRGPQLTPEHKFDSKRRWRFDFAYLPSKVAIEIEGGIWANGRHTRGPGYLKDCEKYNTAALAGWRVFRLAGDMIHDVELLKQIKGAL